MIIFIERGIPAGPVTTFGLLKVVTLLLASGNVDVAIIQVFPPSVENSHVPGVVQLPEALVLHSSFAEKEIFEIRIKIKIKLKNNFFMFLILRLFG